MSGKQRHDAFSAVLKTINLNAVAEFYRKLYVKKDCECIYQKILNKIEICRNVNSTYNKKYSFKKKKNEILSKQLFMNFYKYVLEIVKSKYTTAIFTFRHFANCYFSLL